MRRFAIATLFLIACIGWQPRLDARSRPPLEQGPAPAPQLLAGAECAACNDAAAKVAAANDALRKAQERLRQAEVNLDSDLELQALRFEAQVIDGQRSVLQKRYEASGDPADANRIKELDVQYRSVVDKGIRRMDALAFERDSARSEIQLAQAALKRAEDALKRCNEKCPRGSTDGNGVGSTTCAGCGDLAERIKSLESELEALAERINTIQNLQEELEQLKSKGGTPSQQRDLQGQIDQVNRNHQDTVKQEQEKSAELERLHKQLKECTSKCTPKQASSIMHGPIPYLAGGGAAAAALLAGGGGDSSAGTLATPSPQAQQPPQQPQTPQQPQPPSRQPAGTQNVIGCQCIENAAALDGIAQLCQRLRVIRAQSSGMSITLTGDAPLPTFQGTFNQTTGAFELAATTMLGSIASNTVIAGTVETNGTLGNLRISFSNASGRLTLYNLTTAVGP